MHFFFTAFRSEIKNLNFYETQNPNKMVCSLEIPDRECFLCSPCTSENNDTARRQRTTEPGQACRENVANDENQTQPKAYLQKQEEEIWNVRSVTRRTPFSQPWNVIERGEKNRRGRL